MRLTCTFTVDSAMSSVLAMALLDWPFVKHRSMSISLSESFDFSNSMLVLGGRRNTGARPGIIDASSDGNTFSPACTSLIDSSNALAEIFSSKYPHAPAAK